MSSLLIVPPRHFQAVVFVSIENDSRSDVELQEYILGNLSITGDLARKVKGIIVQQIANIPGATPQ